MDATATDTVDDGLAAMLADLQARQGGASAALKVDEPYRFDPTDWYWLRRDGSLFSSARITTVAPGDADYIAWAASGRRPTPFPVDPAGDESVAALQVVLDSSGGHATLAHYAGAVRYQVEVAGVTATIGGKPVLVSTDRGNRDGMRDTMLRLLTGMRKDGDVLKIFADGIPRPATNAEAEHAITLASDHVQAAFNREDAVVADIARGAVTTREAVDAAFADAAA